MHEHAEHSWAMAQTFACPHCEASYRALPTLVGRKVRCSSCKNVFQLQHTGVAIKVHVAAAKTEKPEQKADSSKAQAPSSPAQSKAPAAPAKKKSESGRPQTRAIRRKDERLKEMRNSLSNLAAQVADSEDAQTTSKSDALEAKTSSGPKRATSGSSKRKASKNRLRESHMVQLTHVGEREEKQRRVWIFTLIGLLVVAGGMYLFWSSQTELEKALDRFADTRGSGTERLAAFKQKLWRPKRLVEGDIPIIANINKGTASNIKAYEWPKIAVFLDKKLGKNKEHKDFPLWAEVDSHEKLDQLWRAYEDKLNLVGFYNFAKQQGISFQLMSDLPTNMLADGFPKWVTYVISMLLVPELPAENQALIFGDSLPLEIMIAPIQGQEGYLLKEQNGYAEVQTVPSYEALALGFKGLEHAEHIEWRVLDVRLEESMSYYFERSSNPLYLYAQQKEGRLLHAIRVELAREPIEGDLGIE